MRKTIITTLIASALALGACAKTPSSIAPTSVASAEYMGFQCGALRTEHQRVSADLTSAEASQRAMVAADAAGVFFVLIPPSALVGDHASDIAQFKGEKIAVERALAHKGC